MSYKKLIESVLVIDGVEYHINIDVYDKKLAMASIALSLFGIFNPLKGLTGFGTNMLSSAESVSEPLLFDFSSKSSFIKSINTLKTYCDELREKGDVYMAEILEDIVKQSDAKKDEMFSTSDGSLIVTAVESYVGIVCSILIVAGIAAPAATAILTGIAVKNIVQKLIGIITSDWQYGSDGKDIMFNDNKKGTMFGGDDNDVIIGGQGKDTLSGENGNDLLIGGEGDDVMGGGEGNDHLWGDDFMWDDSNTADNPFFAAGAGKDVLDGGNGNDWLYGGKGDDVLHGDADDDILQGGEGKDVCDGGDGNDVILGFDVQKSQDGKVLNEDGSVNEIKFLDGQNNITSGVINDTADTDILFGGIGADTIYGGKGDDIIFGYGFNDYIVINNSISFKNRKDDGSTNKLFGGDGIDTIYGGSGRDIIHGDAYMYGTHNNTNTDSSYNDFIDSGAGADEVYGDGGADVIVGGKGSDKLYGGNGNDTIIAGSIIYNGYNPENTNTWVFIENKELGFNSIDLNNLKVEKETDKNTIYGGNGKDTIYGGGGGDHIYGGKDRSWGSNILVNLNMGKVMFVYI